MNVLLGVLHIFLMGEFVNNHRDVLSLVAIFFTLLTCMFDPVVILWGETTCRCSSLLGLKGLIVHARVSIVQKISFLFVSKWHHFLQTQLPIAASYIFSDL